MTLLNLSGDTLKLHHSVLFARLLILIYVAATGLIFLSSLYTSVKILLIACLLYHVYLLLQDQSRALGYHAIVYQNGCWYLHNKMQVEGPYERHKILFDSGLFFVVQFLSEGKMKRLLVFADQVQEDEKRCLCILEKIR